MESTETYVQKMEAQLKEWSAALDRMKAKADKASAETKLKMQRQIDDLKGAFERARADFKD
jgi:hypothetical protein